MKKGLIAFSLFLFGSLAVMMTSCETKPVESCEQDEICTAKFVTACCTDDKCYYIYNGTEYPSDDIDQLADDLGCSAARAKSTEYESDKAAVIEQLYKLLDKAHAGLNK
ncbi:MAG: hypothetical protein JXJ22_03100 [Bacteroidales bacterium]|nr:hypothetical protein [Bacteroidales bacterium]